MSDKGAAVLADMLKVNTGLRTLDVQCMPFLECWDDKNRWGVHVPKGGGERITFVVITFVIKIGPFLPTCFRILTHFTRILQDFIDFFNDLCDFDDRKNSSMLRTENKTKFVPHEFNDKSKYSRYQKKVHPNLPSLNFPIL